MRGEPAAHGLEPHAARRALREILEDCRVVSEPQLRRWGLDGAARQLELPYRVRTVRTRSTQPHSAVTLRFVALDPHWLQRPGREVMHWAAAAELWLMGLIPGTGGWRVVDHRSGRRARVPDAEIIHAETGDHDTAVEVDTGYAKTKVATKLEAYAAMGYTRVLWGVTVHAQVLGVAHLAAELLRTHRLSGVDRVYVRYINFWDVRDPYHDRPRCHKPMLAAILGPDPTVRIAHPFVAGALDARPWLRRPRLPRP
ncbi:hypothetical protein [Deinococcus rufus]|uniref:Transposase n=1 Tax=Deinococcus rufus TaxID=2136097 RepID=A0ABV7ZDK1_9DEIO